MRHVVESGDQNIWGNSMIVQRKGIFACLIGMPLLAGCATAPVQIPPELQYSAPVAESSQLARISGSQMDSALLDDFTVYVASIDGKRVMAERKGWNTPIAILPGHRKVEAIFQRGSFGSKAEFELDASAGADYQVKFTSDVKPFGGNSYVDFWIVDSATQKAVTGVERGTVSMGYSPSVPIFIPVR